MDYKNSIETIPKNQFDKLEQRPIRILHIVGGMVVGGVETTLMHMLRRIDRDRFQMDFLVNTAEPCAYDEEVLSLGSKIIPCLNQFQLWSYAAKFKRILKEHGPYDIVHSHVHHFSGLMLLLAKQAGVPIRIVHSRNDTSTVDAKAGLMRRLYITLSERLIDRYANFGLASSRKAAECLFGSDWSNDSRWQILLPARDMTPYQDTVDTTIVRAELNIPNDALVIGHIGRFETQKNHWLVVEIAAEVAKRKPNMRLLLIGDGALRSEIEQKVAQLNLTDKVIFTGVRFDVPRLMLGAMDIFLFPSFYEGLGSVGFEAQAAGLPCVFSDVIPEEVDVVESLVKRISLSKPASYWAEELLTHQNAASAINQLDALSLIENSPFNIETSVKDLTDIYNAKYSIHRN